MKSYTAKTTTQSIWRLKPGESS
ncbi:Protein of unknown function [Pyronema omphalodes CBS 100304]|uniref:Uncharacterized protein n=1 Tax=Pyronema omphalodes (strain CBS 100304) TaxID=1076935 RepID=U4LID5_PYROM|nr:Protein of unknown function [Pyronema omphalodes CBS 100304]